jgi:serine/threonine-protein kinase
MLRVEHAKNAEVCARFLREGYAANRVEHPGAVAVVDDDYTADGCPFIVMELLEGESLQARLVRELRLQPPEALVIADQTLDVLAAGHARDIIHRDIKPANLFLTADGVVKVLDFGLARVKERVDGVRTGDGIVIGTVSFMPPEQARGRNEEVDARSDLWSVGAVLVTALSGRIVHEAASTADRLVAATRRPAPSLASVAPELAPSLVVYVDRALAFDKAARYSSALEMQTEGRAVLRELTGRKPLTGVAMLRATAWQLPAASPAIRVSAIPDTDEDAPPTGAEASDEIDTQPDASLPEASARVASTKKSPELIARPRSPSEAGDDDTLESVMSSTAAKRKRSRRH